jgi:hypothetical protein
VLIGQDFWKHLTGDPFFYERLIGAFAEVAKEMDCSKVIEEIVDELAVQLASLPR